jgi:hypothetical protein
MMTTSARISNKKIKEISFILNVLSFIYRYYQIKIKKKKLNLLQIEIQVNQVLKILDANAKGSETLLRNLWASNF